jgi:hypothetical protein
MSRCADALRQLRCRGVEMGHHIREIFFDNNILRAPMEGPHTLNDALYIIMEATHLVSVNLAHISSSALLSGLGRTCSGVLTSLEVVASSPEIVNALVHISALTALTNLEICINITTPWPHKARPWNLPVLDFLRIEPNFQRLKHHDYVKCPGLMEFLCKSSLPLLAQFCCDLSTTGPDEQAQLCRFLDLHPDIESLGLLIQAEQWKHFAPHIRARTFIPLPVHHRIIEYLPESVKELQLYISDDPSDGQALQDLWDTLWLLAQRTVTGSLSIVQVNQLGTNFSWISSGHAYNQSLPIREAQLIAGLVRLAILLKGKNIKLVDKDEQSIDDLMRR